MTNLPNDSELAFLANLIVTEHLSPKNICTLFDYDLNAFREQLINHNYQTCVVASHDERKRVKQLHIENAANRLTNDLLDDYKSAKLSRLDVLKAIYTTKPLLNLVLKQRLGSQYESYIKETTKNQAYKTRVIDKKRGQGWLKGSQGRDNYEQTMLKKYGAKSNLSPQSATYNDMIMKRFNTYGTYQYATISMVDKIIDNLKTNYSDLISVFGFKFTENVVTNRQQITPLLYSERGIDELFDTYQRLTGKLDTYPNSILKQAFILDKKLTKKRAYDLATKNLIYLNKSKVHASKSEQMVLTVLDDLNLSYHIHDRTVLKRFDNDSHAQELDIVLDNFPIAIEINSTYSHHSNSYVVPKCSKGTFVVKPKNYHFDKFLKCKNLGITLLQLYDWQLSYDYLNRHFKSLLNILTHNTQSITRLGARNVKIVSADSDSLKIKARQFIKDNHRDGLGAASNYYLVIESKTNDIVAAFSTKQIRNNPHKIELKRLASKQDFLIVGLIGKITKFIKNQYVGTDVNCLLSYSDNNMGHGHGYEKAGFVFDGYVEPTRLFVANTNPTDRYSWQINTPWSVKNGVIADDLMKKNLSIDAFESSQHYIESELSHRFDNSKGYNVLYTASSSRWLYHF